MTLEDQGALVGQQLGRYHLDALLGAGGMAEVYRAHYVEQGSDGPKTRRVAVKVLPESLARDEGYVRRFLEEAERVRGLRQRSNIVPVTDSGEERSLFYLVMPLLKESLRDRLAREGRPPIDVAVTIARQIASALSDAHARDVIHRDVKPENILLNGKGEAFLTDFGIARQLAPRQGGTLYTLSASGLPVGTPEYMPPEQLNGMHMDQRADIYALGAVLYEMLTGRVPFAAETPYAVAAQVLSAPLVPPTELNREIPVPLAQAVVTAMERDPDDRFQDIRHFDKALEKAMSAPQRHLTMAVLGNFRLTERLADRRDRHKGLSGAEMISAAPTRPLSSVSGGLPRYGTGYGTGYGPTYGAGHGTGFGPGWVQTVSAGPGMAARGLARAGAGRWLVMGCILALLLVTVFGGGLAAANRLGLTFSPGSQPTLPLGAPTNTTVPGAVSSATTDAPTATSGGGPAPTSTATGVPSPGATPTSTARPTPTHTATPTATPVPLLSVSQMALAKTSSKSSTCRGPQYITNNSGRGITWQWQSATPELPSSFKWGFSLPLQSTIPINGWPSGSLDPGKSATLYAQITCNTQSYSITMTDSLGRSYTFTMQSA